MGSPVNINFLNHIDIDRTIDTAVYLQLSQKIINCVQRGYLHIGEKLPGTRIIAQHLGLNRNTVVKAFDELYAQAWIEIIPNKGTFVLKQFYTPITSRPYHNTITQETYPKETKFAFKKSILLDYTPIEYKTTYYFTDGIPDVRLNQFKQLSSQYTASMNRKTTLKSLIKDINKSSSYFKEQLSNYLNQTRGLHIGKDNLLINRSPEMSIYLLSRVLIDQNDIVVVAEWSNSAINMCFQQAGATIMTVPIDENGIQIEALEDLLQQYKVRLLYITPHQHYPTTVTLSTARRISLLALAKCYNFIIIEDDLDYDFHYEKSAILPITSADKEGCVIYTGTFAKSLTASFQKSFIVAPLNLIKELNKYQTILDKQGDPIMELALGEMIEEGIIHRYLKKSNQVYRARRDAICQELDYHFANQIKYKKPNGGLAIWVEFNSNISLSKVSKEAMNHNLTIPNSILYQNKKLTAMRIGFGHMNEQEIKESILILKRSIQTQETTKANS